MALMLDFTYISHISQSQQMRVHQKNRLHNWCLLPMSLDLYHSCPDTHHNNRALSHLNTEANQMHDQYFSYNLAKVLPPSFVKQDLQCVCGFCKTPIMLL